MEDNINCIDQMFMTDSHGHSAMDTGNVLNPIDKLYSMQNSYFSVEWYGTVIRYIICVFGKRRYM